MSKFKQGDMVIWLKPIKMQVIEEDRSDETVKCQIVESEHICSGDDRWFDNSGCYHDGTIEKQGMIVHHGFKITSGPEPERCKFKDREFVLVRDYYTEPWKLAAYKGYDDDSDYCYKTYNNEDFRECIPYEGNEDKMGIVTK